MRRSPPRGRRLHALLRPGTTRMPPSNPPAAKSKCIIVDDDRETREMLALALQMEGFEVTQAANGLRLISTLHVDRPNVILLDVNLSWIDGFELCRAVKKNEEFKRIPVIFISARTSSADVKKGLDAGRSEE